LVLCTGIQHRQFITEGDYNTVSSNFLNPVELLDSYKDFTNTNKFWEVSIQLGKSLVNWNTILSWCRKSSTSSRKASCVTMDIQNVRKRVPGSTDSQTINIQIDLIKLLSIL
jgi:iron complex outermembrane receptor protein